MYNTIKKQRGATFIGWIIIGIIFGCFVLFGVRIFPLANEHFTLLSVMKGVASDPASAKMSNREIYSSLSRGFEVQAGFEPFNESTAKDYVFIIRPKRKGESKKLRIVYTDDRPLFLSYRLTLKFDEEMPLVRSAATR